MPLPQMVVTREFRVVEGIHGCRNPKCTAIHFDCAYCGNAASVDEDVTEYFSVTCDRDPKLVFLVHWKEKVT